jgi:two-component system, NtrC family, sensor kinase
MGHMRKDAGQAQALDRVWEQLKGLFGASGAGGFGPHFATMPWSLLNSAPDAMLVVAGDGTIVFANSQTERVFGRATSTIVGSTLSGLMPASARAGHGAHLASYFANPKVRPMGVGLTLRGLHANGTEFPIEVSLSPAGIFVIAAIRDVSARLQLEEQLRISERMASLGTLLAGVAHDLNNPLAALSFCLEALSESEVSLSPSQREAVQDAREAAHRLREVAGDLRTFSRSDSAPQGPVELGSVIASAIRLLNVTRRGRTRIETTVEPGLTVKGHESRLGQLVLNLVANALQAVDGSAVAVVLIELRRAAPDQVELVVRDSGPGLAPQVRERLFESSVTTKPTGQGTGLGLLICRRIVEEHRGTIAADDAPGGGARFTVRLPALEG